MRHPSVRNAREEEHRGDSRLRLLERLARTGDLAAAVAWGAEARRRGDVPDATAEILDSLGGEAWRAWIVGEDWEWQPEDVESGDPYAGWDDDRADEGENPWHFGWSVHGFAVRARPGRKPMLVRTYWDVDRDGNWDATGDDEWPIDSPHGELARALRWRDNRRTWVEYFAWVVENGSDPLGELSVQGTRGPSRTWRFELSQEHVRGMAGGEPISGRVFVTKAQRFDGTKRGWTGVPLGTIRGPILQWLTVTTNQRGRATPASVRLTGGGRRVPVLVTEIGSLDELRANMKGTELNDSGRIIKDKGRSLTVEAHFEGEQRPPTRQQVVAAARRQQPRAGEELSRAEADVERLAALTHRCTGCNAEIERVETPHVAGAAHVAWVDHTGGDACERTGSRSHEPGPNRVMGSAGEFVCPDPNGPDCHDDRCPIHYGETGEVHCDACGGPPGEGGVASEHDESCSMSGQVVCAMHHVCDSLGFDEGAEGENAARELGEDGD